MAKATFSSLFQQDDGGIENKFKFANESLQEAVKKVQESKKTRAVEQSVVLIGEIDKQQNLLLQSLRQIRKSERQAKENLDNYTKAVNYFGETGNFGPLYKWLPFHIQEVCRNLGVDLPTVEDQKLPEGK